MALQLKCDWDPSSTQKYFSSEYELVRSMLNWKTVFLKQNTFSTDAPHIVDCLNSLCFAESFFVLKILAVDLWLKPFNSCIKCFKFKWQEVFCGVYTGVPWGGNSFILTPAGLCRTNAISAPWLASVSVACHDFECLCGEYLSLGAQRALVLCAPCLAGLCTKWLPCRTQPYL